MAKQLRDERIAMFGPLEHTDKVKGVEEKSVKNPEKMGISGAMGGSQATSSRTSPHSGVTGPTIGETTISSTEADKIQDEVRSELRKMFPGIAQFEADSAPLNRGAESSLSGTAAVTAQNFSGESRHSRPEAIAGSEVSVASTQPNNGSGKTRILFPE